MRLELSIHFLQWWLILSVTLYAVSAVSVIFCRKLIYQIHQRWFGIEERAFNEIVYLYLGLFKLFLLLFLITPYLALLISN